MAKLTRFKKEENPLPAISFRKCFAKSDGNKAGLSVEEHSCIAGFVSSELVRRLPKAVKELLPLGFQFLVAAHDTGKISPGFLKRCCNEALKDLDENLYMLPLENSGFNRNHSEIGEAAFRSWARSKGKSSEWLAWSESIGVHHGVRCFPGKEGSGSYGGPEWATQRKLFLDQMSRIFLEELPHDKPDPVRLKLLTGIMCVSDWIASDETCFPVKGFPVGTNPKSYVTDALNKSGWRKPEVHKGMSFKDIFSFDPYPLQIDFIENVTSPGLYILEAPMGLGKTEAALYAAYRLMEKGINGGIYFGLPTRLTSNRIHSRVECFQKRISVNPDYVRLIHGLSWIESSVPEFQTGKSWFHPKKRALLTCFGVGTIDQALFCVMRVKHHFIRSLGLAGKVVILDEVHSYDSYTGRLLDLLIDELLQLKCTVIILSATLSARRRSELLNHDDLEQAYPIITCFKNGNISHSFPEKPNGHTVSIDCRTKKFDELVEICTTEAERGVNVLWIHNTVSDSQHAYRLLKSSRRGFGYKIGLLHSRFQAFRRSELENTWMNRLSRGSNRPKGSILVATQVVEQSVDIDADLLISEFAPSDMILQRIGRLWRHQENLRIPDHPKVVLYGPTENDLRSMKMFSFAAGNSQYVYSPYVLLRSCELWLSLKTIEIPDQIRDIIEQTYLEREESIDWIHRLKQELIEEKKKLRASALGMTTLFTGDDDENKVSTRYGERRTVNFLLVDSIDDIGNKVTIHLLDNSEPLQVTPGIREFKVARRIHQQLNLPPLSRQKSVKVKV